MSTTTDKLNYLDNTKTAIREAIVNKGVPVTETDTFRSYAEKINSISTSNNYPTGKLSTSSGIECYYARSGDIVTLLVTGFVNSEAVNSSFGNLPSDYLPLVEVEATCAVSPTSTRPVSWIMAIDTEGTISLRQEPSSTVTCPVTTYVVTYIASEVMDE